MDFHNTGYAKKLFDKDIPELIKGINRLASAIESQNDIAKENKTYVANEITFVCPDCGFANKVNLGANKSLEIITECFNCGDLVAININPVSVADVIVLGEGKGSLDE